MYLDDIWPIVMDRCLDRGMVCLKNFQRSAIVFFFDSIFIFISFFHLIGGMLPGGLFLHFQPVRVVRDPPDCYPIRALPSALLRLIQDRFASRIFHEVLEGDHVYVCSRSGFCKVQVELFGRGMLLVECVCYPRYSAADMAKLRERSVMADSIYRRSGCEWLIITWMCISLRRTRDETSLSSFHSGSLACASMTAIDCAAIRRKTMYCTDTEVSIVSIIHDRGTRG